MSIVDEVMEAVIALAQATQPFATIRRGPLSAGSAISMELGPSSPESTFLTKNNVMGLDVVLNGKHADLDVLSEGLTLIHDRLTRAKSYPRAAGWQLTNIWTTSLPRLIGRDANNSWLMGSALSVEFVYKGV